MFTENKQLRLFLLLLLVGSALAAVPLLNGGSAADYMLTPAIAAILVALLTRRHDERLPRLFFVAYLLIGGVYLLLALLNVFLPFADFYKDAEAILPLLSLPLWFLLWFESAERRRAYGLQGGCWRQCALIAGLYVALLLLREVVFACLGENEFSLPAFWVDGAAWSFLLLQLPLGFFFSLVNILGEEYGWRYFLQPLLQKKYGLRRGVLLLGIIWGVWHLPVKIMNSPQQWHFLLLMQIITCISLGIFYAWAYLKTDNIWLPVILHYLNNGIVGFVSDNQAADEALATVSEMLLSGLLLLAVDLALFGWAIFSPCFRADNGRLPTMNERAENIYQ